MRGIHTGYQRVPLGGEPRVWISIAVGLLQLVQKLTRSIVREAQISGYKFLIEDRRSKELAHLLLFYDFAGQRQNMPTPRKNDAGDAALCGRKKRQLPFFKGQPHVA